MARRFSGGTAHTTIVADRALVGIELAEVGSDNHRTGPAFAEEAHMDFLSAEAEAAEAEVDNYTLELEGNPEALEKAAVELVAEPAVDNAIGLVSAGISLHTWGCTSYMPSGIQIDTSLHDHCPSSYHI